ncbi:hypothetical protein ACQKKG_12225 [Brevundimonas sp. NPDC003935]|uniref:hypothetical protein n=1 Tax=unclassified Brevundimonas TaxID=2622653 RepID=UPI0025C4EE01|nr:MULTISPECIES: hypothetical protein [unclassified Brevundimonas]
MSSRWIYWLSLLIAALGGAVVVIGAAYEPARATLANPLALLATAVALLLFLRMLFDPRCHRGIKAANQEMMGDHGFQFRLTPVLDPQWGIFGSRAGSPLLLTIRAVLFIEVIAVMLLAREAPILQFLAYASFGVVMMLSLIHLAGTGHSIGR